MGPSGSTLGAPLGSGLGSAELNLARLLTLGFQLSVLGYSDSRLCFGASLSTLDSPTLSSNLCSAQGSILGSRLDIRIWALDTTFGCRLDSTFGCRISFSAFSSRLAVLGSTLSPALDPALGPAIDTVTTCAVPSCPSVQFPHENVTFTVAREPCIQTSVGSDNPTPGHSSRLFPHLDMGRSDAPLLLLALKSSPISRWPVPVPCQLGDFNPRPAGVFSRTRPAEGGGQILPPPPA